MIKDGYTLTRQQNPQKAWEALINFKMTSLEEVHIAAGPKDNEPESLEIGTILEKGVNGDVKFTIGSDTLKNTFGFFTTLFGAGFSESLSKTSHLTKYSPRTLSQVVAYIYNYEVDIDWLDLLALIHLGLYYEANEQFMTDLYTAYRFFVSKDESKAIDFVVVFKVQWAQVVDTFNAENKDTKKKKRPNHPLAKFIVSSKFKKKISRFFNFSQNSLNF